MAWRDLVRILRRSVIRRSRDDRDLDDEIRFYLAQETHLLTERGESPEDARRAAKRAFGNVTLAKENARAVWIATAVEQFLQDGRFGWRIFRSAPGLSATAVLLIALVIGGNTTVFSIAHGILAKPAPGVTAPGLVTLSWVDDKGRVEPVNSFVAYDTFRRSSTRLERLLGFDMARGTLNHEHGTYAIQRAYVTPNYFETLGARFERGRSFTEGETDRRVWVDGRHQSPDLGQRLPARGRRHRPGGDAERPTSNHHWGRGSPLPRLALCAARRRLGTAERVVRIAIGRWSRWRSI